MRLKLLLFSLLTLIPTTALSQDKDGLITPNPLFTDSLRYIDHDGEALMLSNEKDFFEDCCTVVDRIFSPFLRGDVARFRTLKVLQALGLDGIKSLSTSSKKYEDFHIHKSFIQTAELERGLFGLLGNPDEKYAAQRIAPADTNFLLESKLDCATFYTTLMSLLKTANYPIADYTEKNMNIPIPEFGINMEQLIGKIDTRVAIIAKVNLDIKSIELDATLRAENVATLLWPGLKPEFEKNGTVESKGKIHRCHLPKAMPGPEGMMDLYFIIDLEKDLIWISTNEKHLARCRDKTSKKLASEKSYQQAFDKLPQTGAAQLYLSTPLVHDIVRITAKSLNFDGKSLEPMATMSAMLNETLPVIKKGKGLAMIAQKHQSGVLVVINSPSRIRFNMVAHWLFHSARNNLFGQ